MQPYHCPAVAFFGYNVCPLIKTLQIVNTLVNFIVLGYHIQFVLHCYGQSTHLTLANNLSHHLVATFIFGPVPLLLTKANFPGV